MGAAGCALVDVVCGVCARSGRNATHNSVDEVADVIDGVFGGVDGGGGALFGRLPLVDVDGGEAGDVGAGAGDGGLGGGDAGVVAGFDLLLARRDVGLQRGELLLGLVQVFALGGGGLGALFVKVEHGVFELAGGSVDGVEVFLAGFG